MSTTPLDPLSLKRRRNERAAALLLGWSLTMGVPLLLYLAAYSPAILRQDDVFASIPFRYAFLALGSIILPVSYLGRGVLLTPVLVLLWLQAFRLRLGWRLVLASSTAGAAYLLSGWQAATVGLLSIVVGELFILLLDHAAAIRAWSWLRWTAVLGGWASVLSALAAAVLVPGYLRAVRTADAKILTGEFGSWKVRGNTTLVCFFQHEIPEGYRYISKAEEEREWTRMTQIVPLWAIRYRGVNDGKKWNLEFRYLDGSELHYPGAPDGRFPIIGALP